MTIVLVKPRVDEAAELIRKGVEKRKVLVIVGNCWVEYKGRASSKLEPGERIVIIKADGALLVHRPKGYEPVNWMPGGEVVYQVVLPKREKKNSRAEVTQNWQPPSRVFQTRVTNNVLHVRAVRRKPSEIVRLSFNRVYMLSAMSLVDKGEFFLHASEEDMQRAIMLNPSMLDPGFKPITYEKKVEPGFVDVYGVDKDGKFVVVEIKRKTAGREAALQLSKYVDSIRTVTSREVRGILVAPRLAKGVQRLLATLELDYKSLDPKKCAEVLGKSETKKLAEFFGECK